MNKILLFNPLNKDFSVKYDVGGGKGPKTFTIFARDKGEFDPVIAKHVKKHLANAVLHSRGRPKLNPEADLVEINKEIELKL